MKSIFSGIYIYISIYMFVSLKVCAGDCVDILCLYLSVLMCMRMSVTTYIRIGIFLYV